MSYYLHMTQKGFTLIELIVVVALIGLLSVIGLTSYSRVQRNARDVKRMGDMKELRSALLLYKSINGRFPDSFDSDCRGWDASSHDSDGDGNFFIDQLATSNILRTVPRDPLIDQTTDACSGHDGEGFNYYYHRYVPPINPAWGCPNRIFIVFGTDMETSDAPHPDSPGWSECNAGSTPRTWYEAFDYVVGIYE